MRRHQLQRDPKLNDWNFFVPPLMIAFKFRMTTCTREPGQTTDFGFLKIEKAHKCAATVVRWLTSGINVANEQRECSPGWYASIRRWVSRCLVHRGVARVGLCSGPRRLSTTIKPWRCAKGSTAGEFVSGLTRRAPTWPAQLFGWFRSPAASAHEHHTNQTRCPQEAVVLAYIRRPSQQV